MKKFFQVDDSCVLYLSDRKKSTTQWTDLSKADNNGSVSGAIISRLGYQFTSPSTYITFNPVLTDDSNFTLMTWVKIIGGISYSNHGQPWFDITSYQISNDIDGDNENDFIITTYRWSAGGCSAHLLNRGYDKWFHLAETWQHSNETSKLYINGILKDTQIVTNAEEIFTGRAAQLGLRSDGSQRWLNGAQGEVILSNDIYSPSQILNHYGKTRKFYGA